MEVEGAFGHVGSHVHRPHNPQFQSALQVQSSPAGQYPVGFGGLDVLGGVLAAVVVGPVVGAGWAACLVPWPPLGGLEDGSLLVPVLGDPLG